MYKGLILQKCERVCGVWVWVCVCARPLTKWTGLITTVGGTSPPFRRLLTLTDINGPRRAVVSY